ncbi:MAG: transcription termination factor Rho [Lachnospiraceae bacterium]|nr:transcription termination factor Rho [Lachnospiraceae bacterium]
MDVYAPVEELHQEYTDPAEELQKSYAATAEEEPEEADEEAADYEGGEFEESGSEETGESAGAGDESAARSAGDYAQEAGSETKESGETPPRRTRTFSYESDEETCGILEIMPDGYGFIRCHNYLPGEEDVYVAPSQIRKFNLQTGDFLRGKLRVRREGERFGALAFLEEVNNASLAETAHRTHFEDLTPIFPNERIYLETSRRNLAMRIVDVVSPVGKGQRGMIVSPPKAGKTTLLKEIARSVTVNYPDIHLIILLIDERPEEVTDIKEAIQGENVEVVYSTFDELPEHHKRVSEMTIERAKRLVEQKKDVMVLLDSITRLARAYNLTIAPSGRTLSGGLDPAALYMPKKFFGAARNIREGGSLTILATALTETGSRMDDMIFEEFKGTGNMELVLDRKLSERRVFPAIDLLKSGTRREDLIMTREENEASDIIRRLSNSSRQDDMLETVMNLFYQTRDNQEFIRKIKVTRL